MKSMKWTIVHHYHIHRATETITITQLQARLVMALRVTLVSVIDARRTMVIAQTSKREE